MAVDAEINVASDDVAKSTDLRRRVWDMHTRGAEFCNPADASPVLMAKAFKAWEQLMKDNKQAKDAGNALTGFLMPFEDKRTSGLRLA